MTLSPQQLADIAYLNQQRSTGNYLAGGNNRYDTGTLQLAAKQLQGTGGSGGAGAAVQTQSVPSLEDQTRNNINQGYDSFFNTINGMFGNLDTSRASQEGIVNNTYDQSVNDLGTQRNESNALLDKSRTQIQQNQSKNLRDLADNMINSMLAGNVYLGSRGAGDSSAANQYSYALTKLGSKQRTGIVNNSANLLGDVADREAKVQNIYTTELGRLNTEKQNKLLGVAQWFADAQNQLKQLVANGKLNQGKDLASLSSQLLNNALNQLNTVNANAQSQLASLQDWAQQNSASLGLAGQGLTNAATTRYILPQAQQIAGTPQIDANGNYYVPAGYGGQAGTGDNSNTLQSLLSLFGLNR